MHMYMPTLLSYTAAGLDTLYVYLFTQNKIKLNQYLYVYMGAVQGFHKTPLKLLTFKRLRPSLNPAVALWPSHSIILITFCEKAGWRGIIAACWHLFTSRGKGGGGARQGIKKRFRVCACACVCVTEIDQQDGGFALAPLWFPSRVLFWLLGAKSRNFHSIVTHGCWVWCRF